MSKIDRYFYKFDSSKCESKVHLGDDRKELLLLGLIEECLGEKENDHQGINGTPWRIRFFNDQVSNIWYNRDNSFQVQGTEIMGEEFNSIKGTIEKNFENLNEGINDVNEMNQYQESDILYIICRDFFVALIAIIRPIPKVQ